MYHSMNRLVLSLFAVPLFLGACQSRNLSELETAPIVKTAAAPDTVPDADLEPIRIANLVSSIPAGRVVGTYVYTPFTCDPRLGDITWVRGRSNFLFEEAFGAIAAYMKEEGVTVLNDPGNPTASMRRPSFFEVAGAITDVEINGCWKTGLLGNGEATGEGVVKVTWQVISYEGGRREVVREIITTGRHEVTSKIMPDTMTNTVIMEGIGKAASALAKTPEFRELIDSERLTDVLAARREAESRRFEALEPIVLESAPQSDTPISDVMEKVRASAVRIDMPAGGHGSGVLIAPDMVLTNDHVAGDSDYVEVVLSTKRETFGEVLRCDRRRDICLVLIEPTGLPYRPIRRDAPRVGEDVWIIGSPRYEFNIGTVTRGILSRYHLRDDGLEDYVFDATAHGGNSGGPIFDRFGNIIGLVYAGQIDDNTGDDLQLNLGVPILDGLRRIKVEISRKGSQSGS